MNLGKKLLKTRDNILGSTIEAFNPKGPGEWITEGQKLLQTHGVAWLEDSVAQHVAETGVTPQLREMLEAAATIVAEKALKIDAKVRLGVHHKSISINQLLEEYTQTFMDKSSRR